MSSAHSSNVYDVLDCETHENIAIGLSGEYAHKVVNRCREEGRAAYMRDANESDVDFLKRAREAIEADQGTYDRNLDDDDAFRLLALAEYACKPHICDCGRST